MLPEIVREWIEKAEEDYGFACAGIEYTDYFAQICFHFQQALEEACRFLNPFYIDTRYPVHWPGAYDKGTAVQAKEMAEVIRDWVTRALIA